MDVYVVEYWHKHGNDIFVCATDEVALSVAAGIAREQWPTVASEALPESPDGLSDEEVRRAYFDAVADLEGYEITVKPVITREN